MEIFGLCFSESAVGAPFAHDPVLVVLSFIVAVTASYTALELAERLRSANAGAGGVWHAASAIVLGIGIWSMHFIAMLAFESPLERGYDFGLTALSAVVAIAVVAVGFWIVRSSVALPRLIGAGLVVGLGVVAMHYTGMAGLRVAGEIYYRPSLFGLSVLIALAAATIALWLALTLRNPIERAAAAVVMAIAICGMHYAGMAATAIVAGPDLAPGGITLSEPVLAASISIGVVGIVMVGLVSAFYDRRREADSVREAERLRKEVARRTSELQVAADHLDLALRQAKKASAAKSEFLASMSHELRTPLNSILGFAQLLVGGRGASSLSSEQVSAVAQIESSGQHLLNLIDEILDLSRIEAGRMSMSLEPVEVSPLIDEVTAMLEPVAMEAGVAIHVRPPPYAVAARADRRRLQQVLINLISNAIKYNRRGGDVAVRCRIVGASVQISVRDNGAGIPEKYRDELFEPFNRLDRDESSVAGSGVGLALCRRLVEAMRGDIRFDSKDGVGSVFSVTLPLASSGVERAQPATATILYIEDNPSNVLLMRHIAKELGEVELLVAVRPREGIELARSSAPQLILLDINLPELDGFEVLRILKADPRTSATPVFALTANALPQDVRRGVEAGFNRYLTKPIDVAQLMDAISEVLGERLKRRRRKARSRQQDLDTLLLMKQVDGRGRPEASNAKPRAS